MNLTQNRETPMTPGQPEHATEHAPRPVPRRRRRWTAVAAAAAVAAAVAAGAIVLRPGDQPSAEATVLTAAEALADVTSLRSTMHVEDDHFVSDVTAEMSGTNLRTEQEMREIETGTVERFRWVVVDGTEYYTEVRDGQEVTTAEPVDPNYRLAPFGEASAAVIDAALDGSDIDEVGTEEVHGVETTHHRVRLAEAGRSALAELPRSYLGWFDLYFDDDHLTGEVTLDIWTAGETIRRLGVTSANGSFTVDFFDFNADIEITPPPPPYAEPLAG